MNRFTRNLEQLNERDRLRSLKLPNGIDLTSNDYLGLRDHAALRRAALEAIESGMALGSGGSRLLRGHMDAHAQLETFAASYFNCEKALYFATGFQANMALFAALPTRRDVILFDSLIHASARDGIQGSHAKHIRIPHNNLNAYEDALKKARGDAEDLWIAVESVYSMDGDTVPLDELAALAKQYGAYLIVDEAHGTGVCGATGKGVSEGLDYGRLIVLHTCGKAIGVAGGLVCASGEIIDTLINTARPFIYSTAPMPLQAHLVQKSLELIGSAEGQTRREKLSSICNLARTLLGGEGSHIVPIIIGEDEEAVQIATELQKAGYDIRAIRPPTVSEGTARLRLSLSASLDEQILRDFVNHLFLHLQQEAA